MERRGRRAADSKRESIKREATPTSRVSPFRISKRSASQRRDRAGEIARARVAEAKAGAKTRRKGKVVKEGEEEETRLRAWAREAVREREEEDRRRQNRREEEANTFREAQTAGERYLATCSPSLARQLKIRGVSSLSGLLADASENLSALPMHLTMGGFRLDIADGSALKAQLIAALVDDQRTEREACSLLAEIHRTNPQLLGVDITRSLPPEILDLVAQRLPAPSLHSSALASRELRDTVRGLPSGRDARGKGPDLRRSQAFRYRALDVYLRTMLATLVYPSSSAAISVVCRRAADVTTTKNRRYERRGPTFVVFGKGPDDAPAYDSPWTYEIDDGGGGGGGGGGGPSKVVREAGTEQIVDLLIDVMDDCPLAAVSYYAERAAGAIGHIDTVPRRLARAVFLNIPPSREDLVTHGQAMATPRGWLDAVVAHPGLLEEAQEWYSTVLRGQRRGGVEDDSASSASEDAQI
jgi:hypothetical protein